MEFVDLNNRIVKPGDRVAFSSVLCFYKYSEKKKSLVKHSSDFISIGEVVDVFNYDKRCSCVVKPLKNGSNPYGFISCTEQKTFVQTEKTKNSKILIID